MCSLCLVVVLLRAGLARDKRAMSDWKYPQKLIFLVRMTVYYMPKVRIEGPESMQLNLKSQHRHQVEKKIHKTQTQRCRHNKQ